MRRKRISCGSLSILRNGVMHSVMTMNRIVQSPVPCCKVCTGSGPRLLVNSLHTRIPAGASARRKTRTFVHLLVRIEFKRPLPQKFLRKSIPAYMLAT